MLSRLTITALTHMLTYTEATAERYGWDAPPVLLGLFSWPSATTLAIEVDDSPVHPGAWHQPDPAYPGQSLPPAIVLHQVTAYLATPEARPRLRQWLRRGERTLLGFAVMCEGWQAEPYPGYRHGDLNTVPAMADAEIRILTALDTDLRLYQLFRVRGHDRPRITVIDAAPPTLCETAVGAALIQLVTLAHARHSDHDHRSQP